MALQGSWKDNYLKTWPNSYWRVAQINLNTESKTGQITFNCYEDSNTALAGSSRVIGQKNYTITPANWDSYFGISPADTSTAANAGKAQSYALAKGVLDTDSGKKDENDNPIMQSYFKGYADV